MKIVSSNYTIKTSLISRENQILYNLINIYHKNKMFFSISITTKKTHIFCQFCFEFFFIENTYKFCYEKKIVGNCCYFFCKIFCIKHFS